MTSPLLLPPNVTTTPAAPLAPPMPSSPADAPLAAPADGRVDSSLEDRFEPFCVEVPTGRPAEEGRGDLVAGGGGTATVRVTEIGRIKADHPAFLTLAPLHPGERPSLLISGFRVFGGGSVAVVPQVGTRLGALDKVEPSLVTDSISWPNQPTALPREALGIDGIAVASGFLVPGRSTGAICVMPQKTPAVDPSSASWHEFDPTAVPRPEEPSAQAASATGKTAEATVAVRGQEPIELSQARKGWFYHHLEWADVDGDGRQDVITARATAPMFGGARGQLVWLRQPEREPLRNKWEEKVLADGPDVNFCLGDLDGDGKKEVISAEFFSNKVSVRWEEAGHVPGQPLEGSRDIDTSIGSPFDVQLIDLNGDGRQELLVTNHEKGSKGAVYAFEIPKDYKHEPWKRHLLMDGIQARSGFQSMAPGTAHAFYPTANAARPSILLSGDGAQQAWLLTPSSASPDDWSYKIQPFLDASATVGSSAVGDVDGDGCMEIFVPAFEKDEVRVFRMEPVQK